MSSLGNNVAQKLKQDIVSIVDEAKFKLQTLSHEIWSCPELAYQEKQSHDTLIRFFSNESGWIVESHFILETAFRASSGPFGGKEGDPVVNVGFLCEYDALPSIGHACGHNLIAEVGAAAALGLKSSLEREPNCPVRVTVTVLGTPAEEDGGGKVDLILAGAFKDMDVVFMAHPAQEDSSFSPCIAITDCTVKYHGKTSHAAAYPWEGINALDAAVLAYNNLAVLRQQLKPEWRLHGIIKHGGEKPNIIPDYTELEFYLRTPLYKDLSELKVKAEACFRSAALATGCQVEITYPNHAYSNILQNTTLENLYKENGKALGMEFKEVSNHFAGSTDFGNVSFVVPGIHPFFYIGSQALNHTAQYTEAAGAEKAQMYTLRTAKALAMTAVDVLFGPDLLQRVKEEFAQAKLKQE
ncbi:peptidase M20 domain-containing protein 2-like isoform X1 [Alosa sapidissima]|uniref:peptidase M20 domain-containing protein 2-like isoform X1 n=1 Tax=Alosa sapidissima TaxID=34773 RepID=UPI001C0861C9|nr:peptidase M20 domain-containing protein 2-like isoform X1 [Alosa sapidissima]